MLTRSVFNSCRDLSMILSVLFIYSGRGYFWVLLGAYFVFSKADHLVIIQNIEEQAWSLVSARCAVWVPPRLAECLGKSMSG